MLLNYFFCVVYCCEPREQQTITDSHKELDEISRKNSHFREVSSALEMTFHIPALFMELKDLHEPSELN